MKTKQILVLIGFIIFMSPLIGNSQAVRDRNVIPVAVNLNQVLRMSITNGGNIEFTFNTIDDYRDGLSGDAATSASANPATSDPMYITNFTIASSTQWELTYGSEQPTFIGTDDPVNTLLLDNVGFSLSITGTHVFGAANEIISAPTNDGADVTALQVFPTVLMTGAGAAISNAGDITENAFQMIWRCGTTEAAGVTPMNTVSLLDQVPSPTPDRYVTNVLFELEAL